MKNKAKRRGRLLTLQNTTRRGRDIVLKLVLEGTPSQFSYRMDRRRIWHPRRSTSQLGLIMSYKKVKLVKLSLNKRWSRIWQWRSFNLVETASWFEILLLNWVTTKIESKVWKKLRSTLCRPRCLSLNLLNVRDRKSAKRKAKLKLMLKEFKYALKVK